MGSGRQMLISPTPGTDYPTCSPWGQAIRLYRWDCTGQYTNFTSICIFCSLAVLDDTIGLLGFSFDAQCPTVECACGCFSHTVNSYSCANGHFSVIIYSKFALSLVVVDTVSSSTDKIEYSKCLTTSQEPPHSSGR